MRKQSTCSVRYDPEPSAEADDEPLPEPARPGAGWCGSLRALVRQAPLFETRPSLAALSGLEQRPPPAAVFLGLGLCSKKRISHALPLDAFGMLMGAELVRRAAGARSIYVLVADVHALESGFAADAVAEAARARLNALTRIRMRLGWDHLRIVLGSQLDQNTAYVQMHRRLAAAAGQGAHPYVVRQSADTAFFERRCGGIVKVGWTVRAGARASGLSERGFDERGFDECFRRWAGARVPFAYCRAGRVLDDARPKAAPYLEHDPARRICIARDEDVGRKLAAARQRTSEYTVRGVRNQLRVICRTYSGLVERVEGRLEERAQTIVRALC